jgi:hypothetical protein
MLSVRARRCSAEFIQALSSCFTSAAAGSKRVCSWVGDSSDAVSRRTPAASSCSGSVADPSRPSSRSRSFMSCRSSHGRPLVAMITSLGAYSRTTGGTFERAGPDNANQQPNSTARSRPGADKRALPPPLRPGTGEVRASRAQVARALLPRDSRRDPRRGSGGTRHPRSAPHGSRAGSECPLGPALPARARASGGDLERLGYVAASVTLSTACGQCDILLLRESQLEFSPGVFSRGANSSPEPRGAAAGAPTAEASSSLSDRGWPACRSVGQPFSLEACGDRRASSVARRRSRDGGSRPP